MPRLDLQTHGQCTATDDMDTQPPLLYMDPRLADQALLKHVLEEVSEDDDFEPVSSEFGNISAHFLSPTASVEDLKIKQITNYFIM